ncbi:2-oxo-4-hydroxy-4-carboxy-5-ureidoimidazoline decarboxylase [Cohnella sp. AR92]|uniref:2-oxo-4-hydroxy-4-carboxy-5-ureidoimidazoline decarboxylase n=1 Tax=Cohnella sp. AR92 TaxID=648716 RepID=UPI000F8D5F2C|nr:2-oxo-4-hydroxy-4-carboxy-5-ureidoimidazoline decarboxylase [Cohnella sp. AR92]RUS46405.1 2-oxo-4-hydroxy-4-carboxy-5-ureidoimidazoline decarboxylase [Cohnella sp. AR92]
MTQPTKLSLDSINRMSRSEFVVSLGGIFEHSSWVAEKAWEGRPFSSGSALHEAMMQAVTDSPEETVIAFLRAHPDLGTRLKVTDYSASEQQGAGLDRLSPEEYETFSSLNREYVLKFGFPFILAVRGRNKEEILEAMKRRVNNGVSEEREEALRQIKRITRFRLDDLLE